MLKGKTVVIGVSGGIAVYKVCDVVSRLKKLNANVHVIMTKGACEFVAPLTFQTMSQNYVVSDMFQDPKTWDVEHISLAKKADLFLVAPATANVIGKIANGICDDMLTTTVAATKAKVLIAPAMNTNMYENPIIQRNISTLKEYGYNFVEPESGRLACGDTGSGKLASPEVIVESVVSLLQYEKDLVGRKIIITAGPTIESIDPVRYLTNRSSGKMGYAIAKEARDKGVLKDIVVSVTDGCDKDEGIRDRMSEKLLNRLPAILENGNIIKKVYFPREILPISVVTSEAVNFVISTILIVGFAIFEGVGLSRFLIFYPIVMLVQYVLLIGISLIVSSITVYVRDMQHIIGVLMQLLFYITPIVYNAESIPADFSWILRYNPMTYLISAYRSMFYLHQMPEIKPLGILLIIGIVNCVIGYAIFSKLQRKFAEEL